MKTIGFANKYYTLWDVSDTYVEYISKYEHREKQDFNYIQNLSMDFETAKAKLGDQPYKVDLELKGRSTFVKTSDIIDNTPDNIFKFGKYKGEDINKVNDIGYTSWYYDETKNPVAKKILLDNGYAEYDGDIITKEYRRELIEQKKESDYIDSLETGHHFNNGEKVELFLKEIDYFSFEGAYGRTSVVTYATKDGKKLKYMGSSSPTNISNTDFTKVVATIKHSSYNGEKETRIQRIKILENS